MLFTPKTFFCFKDLKDFRKDALFLEYQLDPPFIRSVYKEKCRFEKKNFKGITYRMSLLFYCIKDNTFERSFKFTHFVCLHRLLILRISLNYCAKTHEASGGQIRRSLSAQALYSIMVTSYIIIKHDILFWKEFNCQLQLCLSSFIR